MTEGTPFSEQQETDLLTQHILSTEPNFKSI
jgi:hypothetical protein